MTRVCACGTTLSRYNKTSRCARCERREVGSSTSRVSTESPAEQWLWTPKSQSGPPDGSNVGEILKDWRKTKKLTQTQLAAKLNFSQPYISMVEKGENRITSIEQLWHIASTLDIVPDELGLLPDRSTDGQPVSERVTDEEVSAEIAASRREWRTVRQYLDRHRGELNDLAAGLYPDAVRVESSAVISRSDWLAPEPVELSEIALTWLDSPPRSEITGEEAETEGVRPLAASGGRYARYSRAMTDLARPKLFENRPGYRLVELDWTRSTPRMSFGYTSYFESVIDVSTALAHEFGKASLNVAGRRGSIGSPRWSDVPFRSLVGDPFDLARRPVLPSFDTLTIRRDPAGSSFLLHLRDPRLVATASSLYHVMPAGVFQPSSIAPWHQANDFNLWHSLSREFAEEFLGEEEADGTSPTPIDYEGTEPFHSFNDARRDGKFRVYLFGVGLDPLTLCGEMLSVAVVDADAFDQLFADLVVANQEGSVVSASSGTPTQGIPFTDEAVQRLLTSEPLAAPARACLELAWRHRDRLVG